MRHFKKSNLYKASNVTFNPETNSAYSYDWWQFVAEINGKIVFNTYYYSPSTCGHQHKVRRLLNDLGIKIDLEVSCPSGLQSDDRDISVDQHYSQLIKKLKEQINKPRSHERKNKERRELIKEYTNRCVEFKLLTELKKVG